MKKNLKKGNSISVDMTGVEASSLVAEGDYGVRVAKVEQKIAESSGKPTLAWEFEIIDGGAGKLFYNTSLQPQALFNLKNVLICLGIPVPNGKLNLDLEELVDCECGVTVGHEVYDGKKKARIVDIWPLDESGEEGDEEGEEDDDGEDYSELSKDDLRALCKEREIKFSKKDSKDDLVAKLEEADAEEESEEEGEEEGEDEGEDEAPDYSVLELADLKALCKERGLKVMKKDTQKTLIAKLEKADEEEDV